MVGAIDVTKAYKFIRSGAIDVTKPFSFRVGLLGDCEWSLKGSAIRAEKPSSTRLKGQICEVLISLLRCPKR